MNNRAPNADRYYQLVLLWPRDPAKFASYLERVRPLVEPYGAGLERQFSVRELFADGLKQPETVNLVYYGSRDDFSAFHGDQRFREIVHLRTESTDLASVEGPSVRGDVGAGAAAERVYLIEIARYDSGGAAAYRAYEAEAEPVMARYGYHVERAIRPETASGLPFEPDLVKVAYFDAPDGMERMHRDPAHAHIETVLYPRAVSQSVWIVAKAVAP
jgi:uncharacterized protein (DUF1330 family)